MVGMPKGKYRRIKIKKRRKAKKTEETSFRDLILAVVNVALLFPFVYLLSIAIANIIRFILKIISEVI